jgi:hypothetical protein
MDLLERYLQAVKFFLPRRQQDDIVRELSENLISQIEDRQEELGRALTEDELADLLRRHGHPMLVAGRYRSHQQLIGPVFFPMYLFALKVGLAITLLVTVIVATIGASLNGAPLRHALEAFLELPGRALMMFAWTTLGFAALDLARSRLTLTHKWDPRSLPKVVRHADQISRRRALCELMLATACVIWLLLIPWAPVLFLGPADRIFDLAPIWRVVYVPILLLTGASLVVSAIDFIRPYRTAARSLLRAGIHVFSFLVSAILLGANEWVVAKAGATLHDGVSLDRLVSLLNVGVKIGLIVACIVSLIELARELRRASSRSRMPPPASDSAAAHAPHVNGA